MPNTLPSRPDGPTLIVLAAGRGARLGPLTEARPKALLELAGRSLLERSLWSAADAGIGRAVILTGYRREVVEDFVSHREWGLPITFQYNDRHASANNIVTVSGAIEAVPGEDLILLNCDVVFDPGILRQAVDAVHATGGPWLSIDTVAPVDEEAMKVQARDGRVTRISKSLPLTSSAGEFIGISAWRAIDAAALRAAADALIARGKDHLYYEDAIDVLCGRGQVGMLDIGTRSWAEIDSADDLPRALAVAERIAEGGR